MASLPTPGVTTDWGDDLNAAIESLHLTGTHAARPTTNLTTGTLYSCTDHNLIYKWTGAAWTTWASLGSTLTGASVYKNDVAQSVANVTYAVLTMGAEAFDTNAFHDNVTNPSRITIPAGLGGTYLVGASAILSNSAANQSIVSGIFKNGVDLPGIPNQRLHTSLTGITVAVASSTVAVLAAGDYLEAYVYHTMGGARDVSYATLWAIKIG